MLESEKYQKDKSYWEEKFAQIPEVATIPGSKENVDESDPSGNRKKFFDRFSNFGYNDARSRWFFIMY